MEQHIIDNLKSLKTLLDSGVLSAEEFEKEKKNILSECNNKVSHNQTYTNPQVKTEESKGTVKSHKWSNVCLDDKALLWWAVIYVVAGIITTFIWNMISSYGFWNVSLFYRKIYYILLIICHVSNILPALAIKNKTYRIPCAIGVGLLSLYYIYETIQNMIHY